MIKKMKVVRRGQVAMLVDAEGEYLSLQSMLDGYPDGEVVMVAIWRFGRAGEDLDLVKIEEEKIS